MKKMFILLFAALLAAPTCFAQVFPPNGEEEIIIKNEPGPGDERGDSLAQAFLVNGDISISLASSLGVTSITVENSFGQTVYYTTVDTAITSSVLFAAPVAPDTYSLIIQASSYFGIGVFEIE